MIGGVAVVGMAAMGTMILGRIIGRKRRISPLDPDHFKDVAIDDYTTFDQVYHFRDKKAPPKDQSDY